MWYNMVPKILPSPNSYQYLNMLEAVKKNAKVIWWQNDGKLKKVYIYIPSREKTMIHIMIT